MKATEVEKLIDTLDHAERPQVRDWRLPLADLTEQLSKAQRVRRWIATPLLGVSVALPQVWGEESWSTWVAVSALVGTFCMWVMQRVLERTHPVLAREARIDSLRNYFAPWRDDEPDEERTS